MMRVECLPTFFTVTNRVILRPEERSEGMEEKSTTRGETSKRRREEEEEEEEGTRRGFLRNCCLPRIRRKAAKSS